MREVKPSDLDREELQRIRDVALDYAGTPGTNPLWKLAYMKLAEAADYIDAMRDRSTIEK